LKNSQAWPDAGLACFAFPHFYEIFIPNNKELRVFQNYFLIGIKFGHEIPFFGIST
jgi:hypothetical protein